MKCSKPMTFKMTHARKVTHSHRPHIIPTLHCQQLFPVCSHRYSFQLFYYEYKFIFNVVVRSNFIKYGGTVPLPSGTNNAVYSTIFISCHNFQIDFHQNSSLILFFYSLMNQLLHSSTSASSIPCPSIRFPNKRRNRRN